MKVMIFGAGYSGKAIARAYRAQGADVVGTTRSAEKAAALTAAGARPVVFDGNAISADLRDELLTVTHLIQSIAPGQEGDPLLRLIGGDLATWMPQLRWMAYLSTVGVYGDHDGAWVDEDTPCRPVSARSVERVDAETAWTALAEDAGLPLAILRLSGIYGPGRNGLVNMANGTARRLVKKDQVFNRIRVEDIADATVFLSSGNRGGTFNVTDDEPAPPQDVVTEAARLLGLEPPAEQPFETAELTPMARSFYGENKRVSNARIKSMGFRFSHPDYRVSLADLLASGRWNHQS